jgi:hypothetical protein
MFMLTFLYMTQKYKIIFHVLFSHLKSRTLLTLASKSLLRVILVELYFVQVSQPVAYPCCVVQSLQCVEFYFDPFYGTSRFIA